MFENTLHVVKDPKIQTFMNENPDVRCANCMFAKMDHLDVYVCWVFSKSVYGFDFCSKFKSRE